MLALLYYTVDLGRDFCGMRFLGRDRGMRTTLILDFCSCSSGRRLGGFWGGGNRVSMVRVCGRSSGGSRDGNSRGRGLGGRSGNSAGGCRGFLPTKESAEASVEFNFLSQLSLHGTNDFWGVRIGLGLLQDEQPLLDI